MDTKISIIGSGNVAFHLAQEFHKNDITISEIYSRNLVEGLKLSKCVNANYCSNILDIGKDSSVIIIAVSDDAISDVCKKLKFNNKILVHTSGVVGMELLKKSSSHFGSFYPLQTFTKGVKVDFEEIPILINASDRETFNTLNDLALKISKKTQEVTDEEREKIHVSAVLVNNFTNHLYHLSSDFLEKHNLDFELLKPLILETSNKIISKTPKESQTGPAKRNDKKTIKKHLKLIKNSRLKKIYSLFSKSISQTYND